MNEQSERDIIYAEDVGHYWKTSQSSPDTWLENTNSGDYPSLKNARAVARRLNNGEKYIVGYCVYNVELSEITFTGFLSEEAAQANCDKLNAI